MTNYVVSDNVKTVVNHVLSMLNNLNKEEVPEQYAILDIDLIHFSLVGFINYKEHKYLNKVFSNVIHNQDNYKIMFNGFVFDMAKANAEKICDEIGKELFVDEILNDGGIL